jgi:4-amino-4-deoxy-L-arabinose transferase-like glycosyltransferase
MKKIHPSVFWTAGVMLALYLAAIAFRPLLPIDETRYMTVAWEMRLHNGWLSPLTLNFEPYHHKPPMLFWLINLFWSVFGVNRWAGLIPIVLSSFTVVMLTARLGRKLVPDSAERIPYIMLASVPFVIYGTLVMFDLTLTVFVLCALLCLLTYAEKRQFKYMALMALCIGFGVLTKGPVAYLYVIFPMLLAPLWVKDFNRPVSWYGDCVAAIALSILPVFVWLGPVLAHSDNKFAFWLLWNQTAGRVTGNFADAHVRPFYFYLPFIPVMFLPWIGFPSFWRSLKNFDVQDKGTKFLLCWIAPVFFSFCCISGKQPHYLLPLLPAVALFIATQTKAISIKNLQMTVLSVIALTVSGQCIAGFTVFKNYDLTTIADYVGAHSEKEFAWVRNYHGEIGFLGRLEHPLDDVQRKDVPLWFMDHPGGLAIIRYEYEDEVTEYKKILSHSYRGKSLGIFEK